MLEPELKNDLLITISQRFEGTFSFNGFFIIFTTFYIVIHAEEIKYVK